ncbi:MAG TPA: TMEM175 family protein [Candidatus Solibacter sp.]|nr:TMEM175 family protein [Candidatus Solibacter sp.]
MNKRRVENFSDGIFAVAITILIFNIPVPNGAPGTLFHSLTAQWPTYVAYVASFLTIGVMWINHHAIFERMEAIDRPLLMLNLLLVMLVVFIPYPTELLGKYIPAGGADARTAATFYALVSVGLALMFSSMWTYVITHPALLRPDFDRDAAWKAMPRFAVGFVVYILCVPLAQISPIATVVVLAAVAVYYFFERLPEPAAGKTAGHVLGQADEPKTHHQVEHLDRPVEASGENPLLGQAEDRSDQAP